MSVIEALLHEEMGVDGFGEPALLRNGTGSSCGVQHSHTTRGGWHAQGLTGAIHETGHALYEQGRNLEYDGLPVNEARLSPPAWCLCLVALQIVRPARPALFVRMVASMRVHAAPRITFLLCAPRGGHWSCGCLASREGIADDDPLPLLAGS